MFVLLCLCVGIFLCRWVWNIFNAGKCHANIPAWPYNYTGWLSSTPAFAPTSVSLGRCSLHQVWRLIFIHSSVELTRPRVMEVRVVAYQQLVHSERTEFMLLINFSSFFIEWMRICVDVNVYKYVCVSLLNCHLWLQLPCGNIVNICIFATNISLFHSM